MKKLIPKIAVAFVGIYALGATFFAVNQNLDNAREKSEWEATVQKLEQKNGLLQRKYADANALSQELTKVRYTLESRNHAMVTEIDSLKASRAEDEQKMAELSRKIEARSESCRDQVAAAHSEARKIQTEREKLQKSLALTVSEKAARESEIQDLKRVEKGLRSDLEKAGRQFQRCKSDNADLAKLAREVLAQFENKGVMDSFMAAEPFTQIKRVKMEKLIQEYEDKIDKETLK